jgi:hypothetical protein
MQQWNLSIQRELIGGTSFTAAYVGSKGTNLMGHRNINTAEPIGTIDGGQKFFGAGGAPLPRRNPNYQDITMWDWGYDSHYHGMTLSLRKRFADGLQFQTSYTWGKSLDTNSRGNVGDFSGPASEPQDTYDLSTNYGPSDHHVSQSFRFNWAYALPLSGSGAAGVLLQGWQVQGIVSLNTGGPLQVNLGGGPGLTDYNRDRARGQERPSLVAGADPNPVLKDGRDPSKYFDAAAFFIQRKGVYGNIGKNTLVGPGLATLDLSFLKDTDLSENVAMQFRAEFFNILNRANFGSRGMGLNAFSRVVNDAEGNVTASSFSGTAGRITMTGATNRQIQVALRFIF